MELQVSYNIFAEIQKNDDIWINKGRYKKILRSLCEQKKVNIIETEACPDHIHMLVEIPSNLSVAQFMGYLKGKSSLADMRI